ncbi:hypothetical protein B0H67DRAFT_499659, partial [Lasiosphaeris hirsuta]
GKSLPRSGRPRVHLERDPRRILRAIEVDPFISTKEVRESYGLTYSTRIIT